MVGLMNSKTGIKNAWVGVGDVFRIVLYQVDVQKDGLSQKFADASEQNRSSNRNGKGTGSIPCQSTDC